MVSKPIWPNGVFGVPQITPYTVRDAHSLLELIKALRDHIVDELHPNLQAAIDKLVADVEAEYGNALDQYVNGVQEFQRIHDAFMSDVNAHLIALNDGAVSDLVEDETSRLGEVMREIFTDRQSFADLSGDLEWKLDKKFGELDQQHTEFTHEVTSELSAMDGRFDTTDPVLNHRAVGITENMGADELQAVFDEIPEHSTLTIPSNMWFTLSDTVKITKPITIKGGTFTGNGDLFEVLSDDVTLENMTFIGRGHNDTFSMSRSLVRFTGSADRYLRNIIVKGLTITDTDGMGLRLNRVRNFTVERCHIERYRYAGISCYSCENGVVTQNTVKHSNSHASVNHNCYGISVSNDQSKGYDDISKNIVLSYNTVEDNPHWEGIETHNGVNISFLFNIVKGCRRGISIGGAMQVAGAGTHNRVIGNYIDCAGASDEIHNQILGITIAGTSDQNSPVFRSAIVAMNTVLNAHEGDYILYHGDSNTAGRRYDLDGMVAMGNAFNSDPVGESTSGYHDTRWVDFSKYIEYSWGVSSWVSDPLKVRILSTPRGREIHIKGVASRSSDLTNKDLGRLRTIIRPNTQADVFGPNGQYVVGEVFRTNGSGSAKLVLTETGHLTTTARVGNLNGNWVVDAKFLV